MGLDFTGPCKPAISDFKISFEFRAMQNLLSQIPDLDEIWWPSILAAIMSFVNTIIKLGLCIPWKGER